MTIIEVGGEGVCGVLGSLYLEMDLRVEKTIETIFGVRVFTGT